MKFRGPQFLRLTLVLAMTLPFFSMFAFPDWLTNHPDANVRLRDAMASRDFVAFEAALSDGASLGPAHPDTLWSTWGVAASLVKLDRSAEAVQIIDECLQRAEDNIDDSRVILKVMELRLRHFEKIRDVAGCLETAGKCENLKRTDAESLHQFTRFRAVCAAVIHETDKTSAGEAKANEQADRAMAWLNRAIAAGYNDADQMQLDTYLEALRGREDFKKLLAKLQPPP